MKLAEALLEKKELNQRVVALNNRILEAAVYPEGEMPEDEKSVEELFAALNDTFNQLQSLTVRINQTNNLTPLTDGSSVSLMVAIAQRDVLKIKLGQYNNILTAIRQRNRGGYRYDTNTKMVLAEGVHVSSLIELVDSLSKELRLLDTALQAANWATELI
jgi:hypothetical protein